MRHLLKSDNRGISNIIGYVILISIAIGLSIMVYNYIAHYVPEETVECPEGVSLSLHDIYCDAAIWNLTFTLKNSGLFSIDGYRVRVNDHEGSNIGLYELDFVNNTEFKPGDEVILSYDYELDVAQGKYESTLQLLEIQPFYVEEGKTTYCRGVISDLDCSNVGGSGPYTCVPDCDGKECDSDGCGGSCGTCNAGEDCDGGICVVGGSGGSGECDSDSECGSVGLVGGLFCQDDGNVYQNYISYTCHDPGTATSYCSNSTTATLKQTCDFDHVCSGGVCQTLQSGLTLYSIASSSDGTKLVVGDSDVYNIRSYIYTSTDSGVTWTQRRMDAGQSGWMSVASSSDGTKLVAAAWGKGVYTSSDSGVTWILRMAIPLNHRFLITQSLNVGGLAAIGFDDYIYTSSDSGVTWTKQTGSGSMSWKSIASSLDATKIVATVQNGYIYTSIDSGVTWTQQTGSGSRDWSSVASSSDGTKLVAAVRNSYIYTSTDSGVTWTQQTGSGSKDWMSIASSSDGTKLAAIAWNSYIYTSIDSGVTWTPRTGSGLRNWISIASSSDGTKLAAVAGGYVYTSIDSGVTWTQRTVV